MQTDGYALRVHIPPQYSGIQYKALGCDQRQGDKLAHWGVNGARCYSTSMEGHVL